MLSGWRRGDFGALECILGALLSFLVATTCAADLARPRPDGVVDDFEGELRWEPRLDGGQPPKIALADHGPGTGRCLRVAYTNGPAGWGNIQCPVAMTGEETAVTFRLLVERADAKAVMHVWLMESDGDGWLIRVRADGKDTLAALVGQPMTVRLPLRDFSFQPRGNRQPHLSDVNVFVIGCNYGDFVALVDDVAFELPPEVSDRLRRQEEERRRAFEEAIKAMNWKPSERGSIAIFRDQVPPAEEGIFSDPEYLGEVLRRDGYAIYFLSASQLALPDVLRPDLFDLLVLPYGPRFPREAAEALRQYLRDGGRFISVGGYAFDEAYFASPASEAQQLVNGGFEEAGDGDLPAGWAINQARPDVSFRRVTDLKRTGQAALEISVGPSAPVNWYILRQRIDKLDKTARYELSGWIRVADIRDGPGGYLAVDFYRESGERISFVQTEILAKTDDWRRVAVSFSVPEQTAYMSVNCLLYGRGTAWFDDVELRATPPSLNTRHAVPRDKLHTSDDQIPVFDPSFRLQRVAEVRAAEGQYVVPAGFALQGPLQGYAATALWGSNDPVAPKPYARWIPLLRAYDEYGHLAGTVGAMVFHHAGPWKGSGWAFFGATDRDLFPRGDDRAADLLRRLVAHLLRGVYLSVPKPSFMCYRDGEAPAATVLVGNNGRTAQEATVRAIIRDARSERTVGEQLAQTVTLKPGETQTLEFRWPVLSLPGDLYEVRFTANVGGSVVDEVSTGFAMWRPQVVASGPDVRWRDNYFHLGDAGTGSFLCGTNQTGVVVVAWWENPLTWDRELSKMHDYGLRVLRVLHISAYAGELTNPDEKFLRRWDAFVQMCQRHGIAVFPTMHDWLGGISIPSDVLEKQSRFAAILAERYRDVPGFIINVENEAPVNANDHQELRGLYNDFLRELYHGDEAALKKTWGEQAAFGAVPFTFPPNPEGFHDLRWLDLNLFRRRLVERWLASNCGAMRAVNTRHAITDEYYLLPGGDAGPSNRHCDFVNIHCYGLDQPAQLKYYDHSAEGMGFAVGEFSRRSHPSFAEQGGWGWAPEKEVRRWYWHLVHACVGAGGSLACNWDWKDMESCIFPWGLLYPCDLVPKSQLRVFSALAYCLGKLRLTYAPPQVYVLLPDLHLLGGPEAEWPPGVRAIDTLLRCGVSFGVLHDMNIDKLPAEARVVFYPAPFAVNDETYRRLAEFVRAGGTLYVSGDLSYDERHQRNRVERLVELCGVRDGGVVYEPGQAPVQAGPLQPAAEGLPVFDAAPCVKVAPAGAEVLAQAAGQPIFVRYAVGAGQVLYLTDPVELRTTPDRALYRHVLKRAGATLMIADPDAPDVTVMLPPQKEGGLAVLYDGRAEGSVRDVSFSGARLGLSPRGWALLAWGASGRPYAIEGTGVLSCEGFQCTTAEDPVFAVSVDGGPLADAREILMVSIPIAHDAYTPIRITIRLAGAERISASAGEYVNGQWQELQRLSPRMQDGAAILDAWPSGVLVRMSRQ